MSVRNQNNLVRTTILKSELTQGMTVEVNGEILTVGEKDISYSSFMGHSFRGSAYPKTITRIQFAVPTAFGIQLRD